MHVLRSSALVTLFVALASCRNAAPPERAPTEGTVALTQSVPTGVALPQEGYVRTDEAWLDLVNHARERLDLAFFYGSDRAPSRLTPVLEAIAAAPSRGVRTRAVFEKVFLAQYPEIPERLRVAGVGVRIVDRSTTTGGIVHTKMIAADGARAWVGSANLDWRSLEHIHEVGVLVQNQHLAAQVHALVDDDFEHADTTGPSARTEEPPLSFAPLAFGDETVRVAFAASPPGYLPAGVPWDWPALATLIASARRVLRLEFLSYGAVLRSGEPWPALEQALVQAAGRGIAVTLVVSSWAAQGKHRSDLVRLHHAGIRVQVATIPEDARGPIPFARVVHGKVIVADDARCWVGTSNGEGDYFLKSRNAGFFFEGIPVCAQISRTIETLAAAPLGAPLAP
jgi:phosphatidylserine/phosphatidylglycerophosphate/cardiolipin synthase-like enzyme